MCQCAGDDWSLKLSTQANHHPRFTIYNIQLNKAVKGPVQSKSMFISIDQLPQIIEFHTIIVHNYSSVDFILIFFDTSAAILKNLKLY